MLGGPREHVLARLTTIGGNEVESGMLASSESSATLVINAIGWFISCSTILPTSRRLDSFDRSPISVDVEYCARFPSPVAVIHGFMRSGRQETGS